MAQMPIEIVEIVTSGISPDLSPSLVDKALSLGNSLQKEFVYLRLSDADAALFKREAYRYVDSSKKFMNRMDEIRSQIHGYHPYLLAFINAELDGDDYRNIFGSSRAERGLGVLTIANVGNITPPIIPNEKMAAYLLYYMARYTLNYIVPSHKNHDDTGGCVYDRKIYKPALLESMRAGAICDSCRRSLLLSKPNVSNAQLDALATLFEISGKIVSNSFDMKPRAFIGSSSEGLHIANTLQSLLQNDIECTVWNQGTTFSLGDATLEALERAVLEHDFGIFVFTPDDKLHIREASVPVARDNVVFELGLFIGKHTRRRAFAIHPINNTITLPSDLAGITMATYDPSTNNIENSLTAASDKIRETVHKIMYPAALATSTVSAIKPRRIRGTLQS